MKLYRYMSSKEFALLTAGVTLEHRGGRHKANTTSVGFCFLGSETDLYGDKSVMFTPEECLKFLDGIVTNDVLVEMEADNSVFHKANGIYADPFNNEWNSRICIEEYCVEQYDRETCVPTRYMVGNVWYLL